MMKLNHKIAGATALLMLLGVAATAEAGIANTRHNMAGTAASTNNNRVTSTGGTAIELCTFCHTPHAAANVQGAPLWNKAIDTNKAYNAYSSGTMQGSVTAMGESRSLVCLSCHDGTQAMDNILNAPGSGGYDSSGGGASGLGFGWTAGNGGGVSADGVMQNSGGYVSMLGTDLSNDHPISIPYCGGGVTITTGTVAGSCSDADFKAASGDSAGGYVDLATAGRDKTDVYLYVRSNNVPYVECGSCHDPHTENQTFLRTVNGNGSALCLGCHSK